MSESLNKELSRMALLQKTQERKRFNKVEQDKRLADWQLFYLNNLDIFTEEFLEIPLHQFQRELLLNCRQYDVMDVIASRGLSKTFCIALLANNLALILPNISILITSMTLSQSNIIIKEKIDEMFTSEASTKVNSPILKQLRKDGFIQFKNDKNTGGLIVEYGNGSKIFAVNCGESARGKRSNIVIVDEAALIPKTIYDEVIEPTLEPYKFKGLELLPKQIFLTSARTKDNWMWRHLKGTVYEHYRGNKRQDDYKYGFFAGDAYTAVMNGIMKPATLRDRRKKTDDFAFQTEYMNIWLGEGKDAIFKYSDFHEAQIWEDAFIPTSSMDYISGRKREIKKNPNEIRVMGVDIAIVGGKNNDNTAITLGVINTETGIRRIEYIWAKSGMNSILQIMMIKRLYYDYECDYMIYDTQGVGNVFYDLMTDTTEDAEFGRTKANGNPYPAWNINQDKKLQLCSDAVLSDKISKAMQEGERVMIPFAGVATSNSDMHFAMWNTMRDKKLILLKNKSEMESLLIDKDAKFYAKSPEDRAKILIPYLETDLLINETIDLIATRNDKNLISVKEKRIGMKDRYMSMAMFNLLCDNLCSKFGLESGYEDLNEEDFYDIYDVTPNRNIISRSNKQSSVEDDWENAFY